jgi:2-oxo-4-hydroxy-4-carboxy-5-ureidoimidazoline decarboxylase
MTQRLPLAAVDQLAEDAFIALLGGVYEHSPWVAERAARRRPHHTVETLARVMQEEVLQAGVDAQLALIRAHPELIGRPAPSDLITDESRSEQASAGLDRSTEQQMQEMRALNRGYRERFGFPFIVAVRGLARDDIVAQLRQRSTRSRSEEFARCLEEIGKIARFRLDALLEPDPTGLP